MEKRKWILVHANQSEPGAVLSFQERVEACGQGGAPGNTAAGCDLPGCEL